MWRGGQVLILVAHPDDETLAFGGEMEHWPDCVVAHTTNGSPDDLSFAREAGFSTADAYRDARRRELSCALAELGGRRTFCLELPDQHSWHDLAALTLSVRDLIQALRPAAVMTHSYEGGHPDHDAAAFAVQHACTSLDSPAPERIEAPFYNRYGGRFRVNEFLPGPPGIEVQLDPETCARKERMFACFASQQHVLAPFSRTLERYRPAPRYDFARPPHDGPLNYETLGWGITSNDWIEAAHRAEQQLASR